MNPRDALREIRKHGRDRTWWRKRFLTHVAGRYFRAVGGGGTPVTAQDWDNLVVLDACRYDLFSEAMEDHPLSGTLSKRRSVETGTPGFLAENFAGDTFHDVVYVTGNPYVNTELPDDTFHHVDAVWRDGWDEELQTVRPDVMAERALAAAEAFPKKRLIVHFMQPHAPFIGERQVGDRDTFAIRETALGNDAGKRNPTPFELLDMGRTTTEEVWGAYLDNLTVALPAVEELLTTLRGRTAVTSDHGNAMGEFAWPFPVRVYGHPLGVAIPALTQVPWHVYENGDRKTVTADPPRRADDEVDADTEDRLRMLGYAE